MKIPDGDRCLFYAHNPHLVCYIICAVHPQGVDTNKCLDFKPDSNAKIEEQWSRGGYSYYDGHLVRGCAVPSRTRSHSPYTIDQIDWSNNKLPGYSLSAQSQYQLSLVEK